MRPDPLVDGDGPPMTTCCPECGSHKISFRSGKRGDEDIPPRSYRCDEPDCGERFYEPDWRPKITNQPNHVGGLSDGAKALLEMDPDDWPPEDKELATDGGRDLGVPVQGRPLQDMGVAALGLVCQNFPEHPGEEPEMVSAGPGEGGVICPECRRMAGGPDDEIPYGDPPDYATDGGRTYRDYSGLMGPMDVDRPEWAQEIAVGDVVAFDSPEGVIEARVIGFSTETEMEGQPAVEMPDELVELMEPANILVLREEDLVENGDKELATDGGEDPVDVLMDLCRFFHLKEVGNLAKADDVDGELATAIFEIQAAAYGHAAEECWRASQYLRGEVERPPAVRIGREKRPEDLGEDPVSPTSADG